MLASFTMEFTHLKAGWCIKGYMPDKPGRLPRLIEIRKPTLADALLALLLSYQRN